MARVPLSAVSSTSGDIQVYSRDSDGSTVFRTFSTSWSSASTITLLESGYQFSVTQFDDWELVRLYYQDFEGAVRDVVSNDRGSSWIPGTLLVNGA